MGRSRGRGMEGGDVLGCWCRVKISLWIVKRKCLGVGGRMGLKGEGEEEEMGEWVIGRFME